MADDEFSSASSHSSMPGLMSDDESMQDSEDQLDANNSDDNAAEVVINSFESILDRLINQRDDDEDNMNINFGNNQNIVNLLNLLRNRMRSDPNSVIMNPTETKLNKMIDRLYAIIDELNNLRITNYDDSKEQNDDDFYSYFVHNKVSNLLNPSYAMSHPLDENGNKLSKEAETEWIQKQKEIPFKVPHSYSFIDVNIEYCTEINDLSISQWKMNIFAICPLTKLMFIASDKSVIVYELGIKKCEKIKSILFDSAINRLCHGHLHGQSVIYALGMNGSVHVIYCNNLDKIGNESNVIEQCNDNSTWSIGVGSSHNRIAVGSNSHIVQIHDFSQHSSFKSLQLIGHRNNVPSVAYHPSDENKIASVSIDGSVRLWDISDRYDVKMSVLEIERNQNNDEHDEWMWAVCWCTNPMLQIEKTVFDRMKSVRMFALEQLNFRRALNEQITDIRRLIRRQNRDYSEFIAAMHGITKVVLTRITLLFKVSDLDSAKKREFGFDARLQELIKDFEELIAELQAPQRRAQPNEAFEQRMSANLDYAQMEMPINDDASVSTHSSMPSMLSDDVNDNLDDDDASSLDLSEAFGQAQSSDVLMDNDNEIDESNQFAADENISRSRSRSRERHLNGGDNDDFYKLYSVKKPNEENKNDDDELIPMSDDEELKNEEADIDGFSFEFVTYCDDGNEIHCKVKTETMINREKESIKEETDNDWMPYQHEEVTKFIQMDLMQTDNDNFDILLFQNVHHFEFMISDLFKMNNQMNKTQCLWEIKDFDSPFIRNDFKTNTKELFNLMQATKMQTLCTYDELVASKVMDPLQCVIDEIGTKFEPKNDEKKEENMQILCRKVYVFFKDFVRLRDAFIEWKKQWKAIQRTIKYHSGEYLVACSRNNVYLIKTQNMSIVDQINDLMNDVLSGFESCHRLEYIEYIPELSLIVISSYAANRFALIRICQSNEESDDPFMVIEGFYPNKAPYSMNLGCIQGMQCIKCGEQTWRLFVLYQDTSQRAQRSGVPVKIVSYLITSS